MTTPERPILVLSRKKPHLLFVQALVILSGLSILVGGSADEGIPSWLLRVWAGFCMGTGAGALLAHVQRWDRERGMWVERGMLLMQSAGVLAYGLSLPTLIGWTAPVAISLMVAALWAGANFWEVKLIKTDLQLISAVRRLDTRSGDAH